MKKRDRKIIVGVFIANILAAGFFTYTDSFGFRSLQTQILGAQPVSDVDIDTGRTSYEDPKEELETLQGQEKLRKEELGRLENERTKQEADIKAKEKALVDARASGNKTGIEKANDNLDQSQAQLQQTNDKITDKEKELSDKQGEMKKNSAYIKNKIEELYQGQIDSTIEQGKELGCDVGTDKEKKECKERKAAGDKIDKEIDTLKIEANKKYVTFLEAKRDLEKCKVDDDAKCEEKQKAFEKAATALRKDIRLITTLEQKKNKQYTFDASKLFLVPGDTIKPIGERAGIRDVANTVATWLITLVTSLAVTALIIGGFLMVISGGDESRLETGKTIFKYSLIGLAVVLLAYGIITAIQSLFFNF